MSANDTSHAPTGDAGRAVLRVALGERLYEIDRPFGNFQLGGALVSDVACDSAGLVHVLLRSDPLVDAPADPVVVLDATGSIVRSFGRGVIADAHMLAIGSDDRIYVVDRDAHQIVIFASTGQPIGRLGERDRPGCPFSHPSAVAVAPEGLVYVADGYGAHRIHCFDEEGRLLSSWGERGNGPGQFSTPHGIWVLKDGRVAVADRENDRVQLFSSQGEWLGEWRHIPRAMDIWSDRDGHVYVTDQVPRLTRFDHDGHVTGCCRPVLNGAHGIWGTSDGTLYLAEVSPSRLSRLRPVCV
jgi:sugar lactone lactonase YvrE